MRVRHLNILRNRLEILIYQNITLASLLTLEKVLLNCTITNCMGTVESRPEPLIDHLRWALSQFQVQFHLSDWRTPFKGWLPTRKDLYLEITLLGALLRAQDMGNLFISFFLCDVVISLVQYLFAIQSSPLVMHFHLWWTKVSMLCLYQYVHQQNWTVSRLLLWRCCWNAPPISVNELSYKITKHSCDILLTSHFSWLLPLPLFCFYLSGYGKRHKVPF